MFHRLTILIFTCILMVGSAIAGEIKTLEEAKTLSAQTDKLILLEFYQDDCEYCSQAAQDAINVASVKQALEKVIHLPVLEKSDYGQKLSQDYFVGIYYPVFYLLNSEGEIIRRWTGYTRPKPFINELDAGHAEQTTLEQRIRRFESAPSYDDAVYLAKYYTEIWDYLKANEFYRQARVLGSGGESAYAYEIFQNAANAAWQDTITFEQVLPYADSALMHFMHNPRTLVKVAQIMTRLGRKLERTDRIEPYIQAAISATENRGESFAEDNILLKSEYALYVESDTAKATQLKKSTLPTGWENKPDQFYSYAKWCLERKINLNEAESLARKAVNMASPGAFRGKVLSTLAHICDARKKITEAVEFMKQAVENDPENKFYPEQLSEFESKL